MITKLDGKTIADGDDLSSVIDDKKPGDELKVTYVRDGETAHASRSRSARGPRSAEIATRRSYAAAAAALSFFTAARGLGHDLGRDRERDLRRRAAAEVEAGRAVDALEVALGEAELGELRAAALGRPLRADAPM